MQPTAMHSTAPLDRFNEHGVRIIEHPCPMAGAYLPIGEPQII